MSVLDDLTDEELDVLAAKLQERSRIKTRKQEAKRRIQELKAELDALQAELDSYDKKTTSAK